MPNFLIQDDRIIGVWEVEGGPPAGCQLIYSEYDLTQVYFDQGEIKLKPEPPTSEAFWDEEQKKWVVFNVFVPVVGLRRSQFLIEIIQSESFTHISAQAISKGGAIANELASLKVLINSSPDMLPDSDYSSLLKRSLTRAWFLLEEAEVPWNSAETDEINSLLSNTLGVDWQL